MTFSDTHWNHGPPLHYIPVALSTLKPATSPQLSYICLDFSGPTDTSLSHSFSASVDPEYLRNDLRWITDEFTRIEREYGGAVDLVVSRTGSFVQLDTSNVRVSFSWGGFNVMTLSVHCHSFLVGPSVLGSMRCDLWVPLSFASFNRLFCGV